MTEPEVSCVYGVVALTVAGLTAGRAAVAGPPAAAAVCALTCASYSPTAVSAAAAAPTPIRTLVSVSMDKTLFQLVAALSPLVSWDATELVVEPELLLDVLELEVEAGWLEPLMARFWAALLL